MIHPTAVIALSARVGNNVTVGPYSIIGEDVDIGAGTRIDSHVVIQGPTGIGRDNRIYPFVSLGADPQDKKYAAGDDSRLVIGDRNTIREYCSLHRGTAGGGGLTRVGDDNWIMACVHIAHDCTVGNHVTFSNHTTLAGHVTIEDYVTLGGFTGVHQFCRVGAYSFSAIAAVITRDVPPYLLVAGNTARPRGLNQEGLKRHGFDAAALAALKRAYRTLYREKLTLGQAIGKLTQQADDSEPVRALVNFLAADSSRGIAR